MKKILKVIMHASIVWEFLEGKEYLEDGIPHTAMVLFTK